MARDTEENTIGYKYSPAPSSPNADTDGVRYKVNDNLSVFSRKLNKDIEVGESEDIPKGKKIRISGDYPQNYIDVNTYNLSKIKPIDGTDFEFVVKLTEKTALPAYYTSRVFYEQLEQSIQNNNPHFSNQYIDKAAIVEIDVTTLLEKIRTLRALELENEVIVTKNLFLKSVSTDETFDNILETVLYSDLIGYISWVTSKPSSNYDTRLLSVRQIGESIFFNEVEKENVESIDDTPPGDNDPPNPLNEPEYPPIGRAGAYIDEIAGTTDGDEYIWTGTTWKEFDRGDDRDDDFNQGG